MNKDDIEKVSQRVAEIVLAGLSELHFEELVAPENPEEILLSDLATAMTALDYNLKLETYPRCAELKATILDLEKQLKNL